MGAVMSGYLETPVTEREVEDGISKLGVRYGACTMQGWRVANEDAMSCYPELTDDSALFAVYDGHGGPEVALYVAKYLPMLLKTQYHFTDGKMGHALREAFLTVDKQIVLEETADELQTLAGTKADDDDEVGMEEKLKECEELNEEANMPLVDLLAKYKKKFAECMEEEQAEKGETFEGSGKGKKAKVAVTGILEDEGEPAAAVENVENGDEASAPPNGTSDASDHKNGTSNGGAAADNEDKEDSDYDDEEEVEEEEEEAKSSEDDDSEGSDDEEGSSDRDSEDEDVMEPVEFDEREGYGSGTTACVAVLKDGVITVANVGDSRCVVCTDGVANDLSIDHKPESEIEKCRVEKAGGRITSEGRINGGLNLSRALGDHQYKQNTELEPGEQMISPMPDIQSYTIGDTDEFMLLACDGIWNVLTSEDAVTFVREQIEEAKAGDNCSKTWLSDIASQLLDKCLAPDTSGDGSGCDNMTCIIVLLNQDTTQGVEMKRKLDLEESEETQESKKSKTS